MPKVKRINATTYQYQCECGAEIELITDMPVKRLPKCFKCGKKQEMIMDKSENKKDEPTPINGK